MKISITINEAELPQRFEEVFKILPKEVWRRRAVELAERERQSPHWSAYFDERYPIERFLDRALNHWSKVGKLPPVSGPDGGRYYDLYSFIHVLSSVYPRLSLTGQSCVCGRLRDGLQSDVGLAAFAHELSVAVHLWSADFDVEFTDIENQAQFDFVATKDGLHLEVDCKTASADLGRQIHQRRAIELFRRITPVLETFARPRVGRTVDIVLPGSLHSADSYMDAVTSVVSDAIDENKTLSVADVAEVNMGELRPEDEPTVFTNTPTVQALERIAERLGRTNPHFHWFGSPDDQAAVVAIVSSRKPDEVADGIYRQLKRSADRQFSGSKPALLATNLLDISPDQLHDLASGPSALGAISDRLFASERRAHLFGVAFVSPADMPTRGIDADGAALSGRGMALLFRRDGHPLAHDPRLALFKPHVHPNGSAFLDHLPFWVARVGTERPN